MSVCGFANCPSPGASDSGRCLGCGSLLVGELIKDRYLIQEVKNGGEFSVA